MKKIAWIFPGYYSFIVEELIAFSKDSSVSICCFSTEKRIEGLPDGIETVHIALKRTIRDTFCFLWNYILLYFRFPLFRIQNRNIQKRIVKTLIQFKRVHDESPFEIVHVHFAFPNGTCCVFLKTFYPNIKIVSTFRGVDLAIDREVNYGFRLNSTYEQTLRRTIPDINHITLASTYMTRFLHSLELKKLPQVSIIPNGFLLSYEKFVKPKRSDQLTIVNVGRISPLKNQSELIDAVKNLSPKYQNSKIELIFIGETRYKNTIYSEMVQRNLPKWLKVTFTGLLDRKSTMEKIAEADILVHCARHEAFGNIYLEAGYLNTAIISTEMGFAHDYMEHNFNGFLYDSGNVAGLTKILEGILDTPQKLREVAKNMRRLLEETDFSMENRVRNFKKVYAALTETRDL